MRGSPALNHLVDPEERPPVGPVHRVEPAVGHDPVLQQHLHVHVVVDEVAEAEGGEGGRVGAALLAVQEGEGGGGRGEVAEVTVGGQHGVLRRREKGGGETGCNGIVGKAYRHKIGFFTTPPLISIIFLKPTLLIHLHMCSNRYILLLIVYIIFSIFKVSLNMY